jgi:hypothetical protein
VVRVFLVCRRRVTSHVQAELICQTNPIKSKQMHPHAAQYMLTCHSMPISPSSRRLLRPAAAGTRHPSLSAPPQGHVPDPHQSCSPWALQVCLQGC